MVNLPALAPETVEPRIAAVLGPGEAVLWQGAMGRRHGSFLGIGGSGALFAAALLAGWLAVDRGMVDLALPAFGDAPLAWLLASLVVVAILALSPLNARSAWDYALTDRRILVLRKGKVWQQATPDKLELVGAGSGGRVYWRNVDDFGNRPRWRGGGFWHQQDPGALLELIRIWQAQGDVQAVVEAGKYRAASAGFALAQASAAAAASPGLAVQPGAVAAPPPGIVRMVNLDLGFRIDVPSGWEKTVEDRYDGPLRLFGLTILPRIIREGQPLPYDDSRQRGWNCLTLRGGPSVGLNVTARRGTKDLTLQAVLDDPWGKILGVKPDSVEDTVDIAGFRGFAVVRNLPRGGSLTGFGTVAVPVMTRQWWLGGHGLVFEIQGIAPLDSEVLQESVDMIVNSIGLP